MAMDMTMAAQFYPYDAGYATPYGMYMAPFPATPTTTAAMPVVFPDTTVKSEFGDTPPSSGSSSQPAKRRAFKSPEEEKRYRQKREKNNDAAKKSRVARRKKEELLQDENKVLKLEIVHWKSFIENLIRTGQIAGAPPFTLPSRESARAALASSSILFSNNENLPPPAHSPFDRKPFQMHGAMFPMNQ